MFVLYVIAPKVVISKNSDEINEMLDIKVSICYLSSWNLQCKSLECSNVLSVND